MWAKAPARNDPRSLPSTSVDRTTAVWKASFSKMPTSSENRQNMTRAMNTLSACRSASVFQVGFASRTASNRRDRCFVARMSASRSGSGTCRS